MKRFNIKKVGKRLNNRGFSLVELLISIAILVIIMLPLMNNFIQSMKMNKRAEKYQVQSTLAASIMEGIKASTTREIIDAFNNPKEDFDIIPNSLVDITRLELLATDVYEESNSDKEQTTCYFAIHGVVEGGSAYDAFIELDGSAYKAETDGLNNYPMPEIINLDAQANGLLFSDGHSIYNPSLSDSDQLALDAFTLQGQAYAEASYYLSPEFLQYIDNMTIWENEREEANMKGEPIPPKDFSEPTLTDLGLDVYTKPNEIKKYVTKNIRITVNDNNISYEIEYLCDWWAPIIITHSIDQVDYASAVENVYLFYNQSVFQEAHNFGDGFYADNIYISNDDIANKINFFVAEQNSSTYNVRIYRPDDDSIAVFTDASSYEAYAGSTEDTNVNSNIIKTYELNRIFDITIKICKQETDPSNRYKEVYYTLKSTKER